ncbi:SAV0927 family protein [Bacillus rubiinfantis]|uniref:SAV0927 family protein n=1 Tax=Bacillus rubiinfantis TaxID=1499680 RepID=UPI0005AB33F1|nr:SAV0927 family protein [Bacillus rubiinfantis]
MKLEIVAEQVERQPVHYFCLLSPHHRYDLTIGYSEHFFGKAMVTSMQTGKMMLLCQEDMLDDHIWAEKLGIEAEDVLEFQDFFRFVLQRSPFQEQY